MGELAEKQEQQVKTVQPVSESAAFMQVIERAAVNPEVDIDKMERLWAMKKEMDDSVAKREYASAMARVQEKTPVVIKKAYNQQTNSHYAKEEEISKAIKPIYSAEGFSLSFDTAESPLPDHIRVIVAIFHSGGYQTERHIDYPYDLTGIKGTVNKTKIHAYKSTVSYARNTLTCMAFNVATGDDDDGNGAGDGFITEEQLFKLEMLITDAGTTKDAFCKVCKVSKLEDLPAAKYDGAVKRLEQKRKENANP